MSSHYAVVPCAPDFFSFRAIVSLRHRVQEWLRVTTEMAEATRGSVSPVPNHVPLILGGVLSRYAITKRGEIGANGVAQDQCARNTQHWMTKIEAELDALLIKFRQTPKTLSVATKEPLLSKIRDFNQLGSLAQIYSLPVFLLKEENFKRDDGEGNLVPIDPRERKEMKKRVKNLHELYVALTNNVLELIRKNPNPEK